MSWRKQPEQQQQGGGGIPALPAVPPVTPPVLPDNQAVVNAEQQQLRQQKMRKSISSTVYAGANPMMPPAGGMGATQGMAKGIGSTGGGMKIG